MAQMKFPVTPDMGAVMVAHSRNRDSLAASARFILEGAQSVAKREVEMMQQAFADLTDGMQTLSPTNGQQTRACGRECRWAAMHP
jgi:hypothetical protein